MKTFITILFTCTVLGVSAQKDTAAVKVAVEKMEQALVGNDSAALVHLLHEDLVFGHSNGWIQTKVNVIGDMRSGYLKYTAFQTESLAIETFRDRAVVKAYAKVTGEREAKPFEVRLFIIQEWVKSRRGWQLILRQGARQQ